MCCKKAEKRAENGVRRPLECLRVLLCTDVHNEKIITSTKLEELIINLIYKEILMGYQIKSHL